MNTSHYRVFVEASDGTWFDLGLYDIKPGTKEGSGQATIATVSAVLAVDPEISLPLMECVHPSKSEALNAAKKVARGIVEAVIANEMIDQEMIQAIAQQ
ncbi:MAG: hypothetical protein ACFCA4_12465 [Cyanophyceae cyanobacterium]